jgi:hypothetical protein
VGKYTHPESDASLGGAPVKNKKKQQEADRSIHCVGLKAILHFPAKDLLLFYIFLPKTCCALTE